LIYALDTNLISDWMELHPNVTRPIENKINQGHLLIICQPIYYEIQRGLLWNNQPKKQRILSNQILPALDWVEVKDEDWEQASHFWANARKHGQQVDDIDVLLAAIAYRLNATIVSSDNDFNALTVKRENWRQS
jgi:predicted nucleic acid-binding protein